MTLNFLLYPVTSFILKKVFLVRSLSLSISWSPFSFCNRAKLSVKTGFLKIRFQLILSRTNNEWHWQKFEFLSKDFVKSLIFVYKMKLLILSLDKKLNTSRFIIKLSNSFLNLFAMPWKTLWKCFVASFNFMWGVFRRTLLDI